jgi:pSer/pThr/pTyr-binding forkhead associated (FHA) protein
MAKLTLSFKDRKLKVFALQSGDSLIGRESDCTIPIDSLAIEPHHARIRPAGEEFFVEPVGDTTPVRVNEQTITEAKPLKEGDQIQIGKHTLRFSAESDLVSQSSVVPRMPTVGWIQIQSGSHLGRTIRLSKAFTRIGRPDVALAVIAHRDQGYYLSHLHGVKTPRINCQDVGEESYKLQNGDQITVGELKLQFFADGITVQSSEVTVTEQGQEQQRQFSRIPFDVSATLQTKQQSWETDLIDISLHGALIKAPRTFEADQEQLYQLAIHLESGPDICMDVLIAHHENEALGLHCKDIDVDSIAHLRRLIELNLGNPELLERELSALG